MATVTVSEPQTDGEGRNKHTSYRVEVSAGNIPGKAVRRRYSDFQWLYNRLQAERPGAVIPIIPHKRAVTQATRFSEELIAERQVQLETFLKRVIAHPELAEAPSVAAFCRATGDSFDSAKKELEANHPNPSDLTPSSASPQNNNGAAGEMETLHIDKDVPPPPEVSSNRPKDKIRNFIARTTVAANVMSGKAELEGTEDDPEIELVEQYVAGLSSHISALEKQSSALVKGVKDNATTLHDLGQSFHGWALAHQARYCPSGSDATVVMLNKISGSASELSTLQTERAAQETTKFEEKVADLHRTVQAIQLALKRRKERQLTYTTRLKQISSRKATVEKYRGKPGKDDKIEKAESEADQAERAADVARDELDAVTKRVLREVERVKKEMDNQIRDTMLGYATLQIEYNRKFEESWMRLSPSLGGTDKPPQPSAPPPAPPGEEGAPSMQFI